ncbi:MAG: hypothetical protein PSV35_01490 [bacterium]|nr:hypothetical protein [bacterium]
MEKNLSWLIASSFSLIAFTAQASSFYQPHLQGSGTLTKQSYGEAEGLIPFLDSDNSLTYINPELRYAKDNSSFKSIGLGHRYLSPQKLIWGGYLFFDYNTSSSNTHYNVLNPGLEIINRQWDLHLNGYFPIGKRSHTFAVLSGRQLGYNDTEFFSGHTQFDHLFQIQQIANTGVDAEIGYIFDAPVVHYSRIFGGPYYANATSSLPIKGGQVGIEFSLSHHASLIVRDSYDNLNHNTFGLTLRMSWGGSAKAKNNTIQARMNDFIPRHIANLGTGDGILHPTVINNTGTAIPIQENIWFFNPNTANQTSLSSITSTQQCTFEHPCTGLSQTYLEQVNKLAPGANLYLSSGNYNNVNSGSGFSFFNGQKLNGRSRDFSTAALGTARPMINDTLILTGNNQIANVQVNGNTPILIIKEKNILNETFLVGISLNSTAVSTNIINNSVINALSTNQYNAAAIVDQTASGSSVLISNSKINASITGTGFISDGLVKINGDALTLQNVSIDAYSNVPNVSYSYANGIANYGGGLLNIVNSSIYSHGVILSGGGNPSAIAQSFGITKLAETNIENSTITTNFSTEVRDFNAQGINFSSGWGNINVNNSTIQVNLSSHSSAGNTYAFSASGDKRNKYFINRSIISNIMDISPGFTQDGSAAIAIAKGSLLITNSQISAMSTVDLKMIVISAFSGVDIQNSTLSVDAPPQSGSIFDTFLPKPLKMFNDKCYIRGELVACIASH